MFFGLRLKLRPMREEPVKREMDHTNGENLREAEQ